MRRFHSVDASRFLEFVERFQWRRRVTEVHLHHTWRPRQQDYRGLATIEAMWRHHTQTNGWSDIAQHVSIAPDGTIWLGRNFNWSPASAIGFNGNSTAGPFMIEMIGDFDTGRETLEPRQRQATLAVIKAVQRRFVLESAALRFHNEMSTKSCPGSSQDKGEWIRDIEGFEQIGFDDTRAAFPGAARGSGEALASMDLLAEQTDDLAGAEITFDFPDLEDQAGRGLFDRAIDPLVLEELSDHIVNLTFGRFSTIGLVRSDQTDVDRIFGERLPAAIEDAKKQDTKARLLVYAHGGLVSERSALQGAFDQLRFWRANHIYPLFFIWETGLAETLKAMITRARGLREAPRGGLRDWLDDQVEDAVRALGGDRIWSAMKRNAELANDANGGATYVGHRLSKLLRKRRDDIELHIAGHSAGSIFLTRFLPNLDEGVSIKTAHFLAPAVTNALFLEHFAPKLGTLVQHLSLFTMKKPLEQADSVTPLYGKSLLYMIRGALEPEWETDVLGLEVSLRGDPKTAAIFGLEGRPGASAEVIWSPSDGFLSGQASQSRTHGDFDNDKATLESVCRRILGRTDGQLISPYEATRGAGRSPWDGDFSWPEQLAPWLVGAAPSEVAWPPPESALSSVTSVSAGRRLALCIGIDNYRHITPLAGCLNDARTWSDTLRGLGFEVETLPEEEATRSGILERLRRFLEKARARDQLVVQYAGHGTEFEDISGDEVDLKDSALCAIDCDNPSGEGGLVIDDDLFEAFKLLPTSARLTAFFDCCHSGTIIRALGAPPLPALPLGSKARFVKPTPAMQQAYRRLKQNRSRVVAREIAGEAGIIGVQFSACLDNEVAYESGGAGAFTGVATRLLSQARGWSNRAYHDAIIKAFGSARRQTPKLYCDPSAFDQPLALF